MIVFIAAFEFQIFEALSPSHRVVSNVEHMIGFMIRKVKLQQLHIAIDRVDESALLSQ